MQYLMQNQSICVKSSILVLYKPRGCDLQTQTQAEILLSGHWIFGTRISAGREK